ncbi:MAG: hypothetical protein H6Q71_1580 [Firmicutes bacterium]|nr:hypothetical protein [Bacillota bacterium]
MRVIHAVMVFLVRDTRFYLTVKELTLKVVLKGTFIMLVMGVNIYGKTDCFSIFEKGFN